MLKLTNIHAGSRTVEEFGLFRNPPRALRTDDVLGDVGDYPLARNLVLMAVAIASETLLRFVLEGTRQDWSVTLRNFAVRSLELPSV